MTQQPLPRRRQLQDQPAIGQPEYAPWGGAFDSPDPSPALRERAESGLEKFFESLAGDQGEEPQR
ncbi:hypothetical protein [Streptomyces erythrochromogenes]|uniref:hypothetical protein n=1 Tax=Streptomyces erythrochromogenes TaxID=285574 RepID=UPI0036F89546